MTWAVPSLSSIVYTVPSWVLSFAVWTELGSLLHATPRSSFASCSCSRFSLAVLLSPSRHDVSIRRNSTLTHTQGSVATVSRKWLHLNQEDILGAKKVALTARFPCSRSKYDGVRGRFRCALAINYKRRSNSIYTNVSPVRILDLAS